jgi:calcineurin-like phosphoesterase family protein
MKPTRKGGRKRPGARNPKTRMVRLLASFDRLLAKSAPPAGRASGDDDVTSMFADRVLATPDGPVIFEDQVLQAAWDIATSRDFYGTAGEGDKLNYNVVHWIPLVLTLARGKFARTREVLHPRSPTRDIALTLPARLAIFGDAGYRGLAQRTVLDMIAARHRTRPFDALIHLGDTYHGGSEAEMFRHLVVPLQACQHKLARTKQPALFSLCGNHDLYAGPDGYLGVLEAFNQPGRYFAIEAGGFRIACLDTTLADGGMQRHGKLDDEQLAWLRAKQGDGKHLVALTHHMPRSAWQTASSGLRDQITSVPGLVAWYWGHEHRAVAFDRDGYYGGCVGNGAFLEKRTPCRDARGVAWYPRRACTCFDTRGSRHWPHGFLELELSEAGIEESWHIEGGDDFQRTLSVPMASAHAAQ